MRGVVEETILTGREVVEADDFMAARQEGVRQMAADESRRASDEIFHQLSSARPYAMCVSGDSAIAAAIARWPERSG